MITWLIANLGTIIVALVLCAVVVGIIMILIRDKKKGKSSCGGNCSHCSMGGCHKN